jgi:hypothetical protein
MVSVPKGLGAKQDGMLAPVTLRQKDNQKGVGYQGHDDTWLAHQEDFQVPVAVERLICTHVIKSFKVMSSSVRLWIWIWFRDGDIARTCWCVRTSQLLNPGMSVPELKIGTYC